MGVKQDPRILQDPVRIGARSLKDPVRIDARSLKDPGILQDPV